MEKQIAVHKVTLSSSKVVLLRDLEIRHQDLAMKAVGSSAGDNAIMFTGLMQKELLKILLVQIDGKDISAAAREDLDALFTYAEYRQLMAVLQKMVGDDSGKFQIEHATYGSK